MQLQRRELHGQEKIDALAETKLDLVLAGSDGSVFEAAHGKDYSIFALRLTSGSLNVWRTDKGDLVFRRAAADAVRRNLARIAGGGHMQEPIAQRRRSPTPSLE